MEAVATQAVTEDAAAKSSKWALGTQAVWLQVLEWAPVSWVTAVANLAAEWADAFALVANGVVASVVAAVWLADFSKCTTLDIPTVDRFLILQHRLMVECRVAVAEHLRTLTLTTRLVVLAISSTETHPRSDGS